MIIYFYLAFKSMFERKKYAVAVVDLCAVRTHPPFFTFVPMGKLV